MSTDAPATASLSPPDPSRGSALHADTGPDTGARAGLWTRDGRPAHELFALDPNLRHLNHGSFGAPLRSVLDAQEELRRSAASGPVRWFIDSPAKVREARAQVAPHLGVSAERIAFVPNASAGASVVFGSIELPHGADIVVTDHGYGAVTMGAERLARRVGGRVVTAHVPLEAGAEESAAAVLDAITDRTALLVIDQVTSPTARQLPVGDLCRAARSRGIRTLVDAAHSPLLLENPITSADADYWIGNLHKFGSSGHGVGVVAARDGLGDELWPLIDSWGASLDFPDRFDHQGTQDLSAWITAGAALDEIEKHLGWGAVRAHASALGEDAQRVVSDAMLQLTGVGPVDVGMPVGPMRLVALPDGLVRGTDDGNGLRARVLDDLGIEVAFASWRDRGFLRLSCHAYNVIDDYLDLAERAVPLIAHLARVSTSATHPLTPGATPTPITPEGER